MTAAARRKPGLSVALALASALTAGLAGSARSGPASPGLAARGERLFNGADPLAGTLSGHSAPLPVAATRCVQCHSGPGTPLPATADFAPPLNRSQLREARPRRGGPAFAYDPASFCRTLRTGIDPAHIVLPRAMPRFDADDTQCAALWDYLTQESTE